MNVFTRERPRSLHDQVNLRDTEQDLQDLRERRDAVVQEARDAIAQELTTIPLEPPPRPEDFKEPAERLDELLTLALDNYFGTLKVPLHHRPVAERSLWARLQARAARDIVQTKLRLGDQQLKRQKLDALPKLLEEIRAAKRDNPRLLDGSALPPPR
jgi:hypothetical protein